MVNRPSRRILYLQVRDVLTERIATGEWKPGIALPNESDLARELGVSPGTVRRALRLLEVTRLITRRQGKGTFVNDQRSKVVAARYNNLCSASGERVLGTTGPVELTEAEANEVESARLGVRVGAAVYRIRRLRRDGGRTILVEDVTLPAALFPGLRDKRGGSHEIGSLTQEYGILLGRAEERVSIDVPPAAVAEALGVPAGASVMALDRVVFMLNGPPVEWRMARCHLAGSYYLVALS